jgi:hypothetical protein
VTLSELIPALRDASSDPVVIRLTQLLEGWIADASTTEDLRHSVEQCIGNWWIASDQDQRKVYSLWSTFRDECIAGSGGMTMNERLFCFNLLDVWDDAPDETTRARIRRKVDFASQSSL